MDLSKLPQQYQDVSTIVSIVPFEIEEYKPGLIPSTYKMPPARPGEFTLCYVGYNEAKKEYHQVVHYWYIDYERGTVVVPNKTIEVALAIVNDYCRAQLAQEIDARPGMFAVQGLLKKEDVDKYCQQELIAASERQKAWFIRLVTLADDDWSKFHQHKLISDLQRYAAKALNLDRDWLVETEQQRCPACRATVDGEAIICGKCQYILKPEKYDRSRFAGGQPMPVIPPVGPVVDPIKK
jgi:hypothetical protein